MQQTVLPSNSAAFPRSCLISTYVINGLTSFSASLLVMGIFFYTDHYLHWSPLQNLLLAAAQGLLYIPGSLMAGSLSRRFQPRQYLFVQQSALLLLALGAAVWVQSAPIVTVLVIVFSFGSGTGWPVMESLVTRGVSSATMSRRVSIYNLTWSSTSAVAVAVSGVIIAWSPRGIFLASVLLHALNLLVLLVNRRLNQHTSYVPTNGLDEELADPVLLQKRQLALWLSRISVPAVFIATYSLLAMLPSLPVLSDLHAGWKTFVASIWLITRWLMFVWMGLTVAWHTRPHLLLIASFLVLIGFLGVVLEPFSSHPANLASMIISQVILGAMMGMIYSGSLYFGMVLSQGSTEHGSYHEALIGLGQTLGPALTAGTQWINPGDPRLGIGAVAAMLAFSCLAAAVATLRLRRPAQATG